MIACNEFETLRARMLERVEAARAIPYRWPGPPDAAAVERDGAGTCASKHAWLAERLEPLGLPTTPLLVAGPLVPAVLAGDPALRTSRTLLEVHECLTVLTPWAGPLRVDVTWDSPLLARGLAGTSPWSGSTDMLCAVEPRFAWSVPRAQLRQAKEALRARLAAPGEAAERRRVLGALVERFERWRGGETLPAIAYAIRELSPHDSFAELTRVVRGAYADLAAMGLRFVATDQDEATTRARVAAGRCFVAAAPDGALLGTITLLPPGATQGAAFLERAGVACLAQLAVAPHARGRGLARRLIERAELAAREAGHVILGMDTSIDAAHLLRFYESLGYRRVEEVQWPGVNYRSVVLAKQLHP